MVDIQKVKLLWKATGAPLSMCKEALLAGKDDFELAREHIKKNWEPPRSKKATAGAIYTYTHQGRIGVMLEVTTATDFVVNSPEFQNLLGELAYQATAGLDGPLEEQKYVRDSTRLVKDLIEEVSKKTGETVRVARHIRWELWR